MLELLRMLQEQSNQQSQEQTILQIAKVADRNFAIQQEKINTLSGCLFLQFIIFGGIIIFLAIRQSRLKKRIKKINKKLASYNTENSKLSAKNS